MLLASVSNEEKMARTPKLDKDAIAASFKSPDEYLTVVMCLCQAPAGCHPISHLGRGKNTEIYES